jgi:hypothetical protein
LAVDRETAFGKIIEVVERAEEFQARFKRQRTA